MKKNKSKRTSREAEMSAFFAAVKYGGEPTPEKCAACAGTGECDECEGEGTSDCECSHCGHEHDADCDMCEGTGECRDCNGTGEYVGAMRPADAWTLASLNAIRAQMMQ